MKKICIAAAALLMLLLAAGGAAEGFDTPRDTAASYIAVCWRTLSDNPNAPEAAEAFPALLEQIGGFLNADSAAAGHIQEAVDALRRGDAASAQRSLQRAEWELGEGDIRAPFTPADLPAAAQYGLMPIEDVESFIRVFSEKTETVPEAFTMVCSGALREAMNAGVSYRDDLKTLSDLASMCGINGYHYSYCDECRYLAFHDLAYYPGKRIVQAWRSGRTDRLTADERQTLDAALQIAAGAAGSDAERERWVHDALCERITYHTGPGEFERKDTAVGALLDGLADCDGYSDAFYLCAALAGLQARYMHGDAITTSEEGVVDEASLREQQAEVNPDGAHMWNLICIDGKWVSVDVTWNDKDPGIRYENYNIGAQRIAMTHVWDPRLQLVPMEYGTLNALRDPSLQFAELQSWDDFYGLCRSWSAQRPERVFIACPLDAQAPDDWISNGLYSTGVNHYTWASQNAMMELFNLEYQDNFRVCDTVREAEDYVEACAAQHVRNFWLYFSPELAPSMFEDDHREIIALLSASSLVDCQYTYNEEERRVNVPDAQYYPSRNLAEGIDDIHRMLWQALLERRDGVWFAMPEWMSFDSVSEDISSTVYSGGAETFRWGVYGRRVTISDIVYYPEFALVSDEAQLSQYLEYCRQNKLSGFRAYCARELYDAMMADGGSAFFALLRRVGCRSDGFSYNDTAAVLIVQDAAW